MDNGVVKKKAKDIKEILVHKIAMTDRTGSPNLCADEHKTSDSSQILEREHTVVIRIPWIPNFGQNPHGP
ncbi:hypothetical protein CHS0354_029724 [Potamilus streckersoni]|uniref:Uncharacterized protein n=1 Tax=Potamilus streckersoni TaxID=2493646 RepID=A0AAE0RU88_9BIVA|nr:hypothetical protein CHS0354_029724 [Potamilus streckersoni]